MNGPINEFLGELNRALRDREAAGLRRRLDEPLGVDFASNDYLGLSRHPKLAARLKEALDDGLPTGAPASRLLRGNAAVHEEAEDRFARFKGAEAALLFPSGYQANVGLLTATIEANDRVLSDALNHASLIDGLRLTKCTKNVYPHLALGTLEAELARPFPQGRTFVVTESLFSMDGDVAPLDRIAELVRRHDALLIVDDAHATGLFGRTRGSGLIEAFGVEEDVLAVTSTCGKALGLCGALVTAPRVFVDHLVNHARSFIYTTAPSPLVAAGIVAALDILAREPWRRARTLANARRLRDNLKSAGIEIASGDSDRETDEAAINAIEGPIVPIPIGDNRRALEVARGIRSRGYDVRALRPPTVPPGTARLRISIHADHTDEEIDGVSEAIATTLHRFIVTGEPS